MAKQLITITLVMSELINRVQNKTNLVGNALHDPDNPKASAYMKANDDDDNMIEVMDSIQFAFAKLKSAVSEYIEDEGTTSNNVLLSASDNLTVELSMPSNFNAASRDAMAMAMHEYIVSNAIYRWFKINNRTDVERYEKDAAESMDVLMEAIYSRKQPKRKTVSL